ncbi:hypothetical protein HELRODRAFT_168545 [Helobdella robusta]|uniref:glutathione transferase n=1 Tax=Helobdella robusta TaxID=6412 RepID=T1F0P6_HELRO|nr:hypothetical protein HELRODRAFT_168545 [Helobdella robusta]ESO09544.1 hypothetical protein HELRODRAFT_168545 [Helobdella robusta]
MAIQLYYFPVRGRAQALRYMCKDNDIKLEETAVTYEQWPALKPKTPLGQMPYITMDGMDLGQSNAILRHVARKHGFYGKNDKEAALIDMLNDQQEDLRFAYIQMIYRDYELGKEPFIQKLPESFKYFEKYLSMNHNGKAYFVGEKVSFLDYDVFDLLDDLLVLSPTCLDSFPLLKAFHKRFADKPKLHAYRETEEFKKMPINGNGKQ